MPFIPVGPDGKQMYKYDIRSRKAKIIMWFWRRFGKKVKYKTFYGEQIVGDKTVYYGCKFIRCKFENLRLVFVEHSIIEYETPVFTPRNLTMCSFSHCSLRRLKPLVKDKSGLPLDQEKT